MKDESLAAIAAGGKSGLHRARCPGVMPGRVRVNRIDGKCHRKQTAIGIPGGKGEKAV